MFAHLFRLSPLSTSAGWWLVSWLSKSVKCSLFTCSTTESVTVIIVYTRKNCTEVPGPTYVQKTSAEATKIDVYSIYYIKLARQKPSKSFQYSILNITLPKTRTLNNNWSSIILRDFIWKTEFLFLSLPLPQSPSLTFLQQIEVQYIYFGNETT
jgi:hypothetical protein